MGENRVFRLGMIGTFPVLHDIFTLWLFNIAMENDPFIDNLPIKNGGSFHGLVITRW